MSGGQRAWARLGAALALVLIVAATLPAPLAPVSAQEAEQDPPWVHEEKRAAEEDPARYASHPPPESRSGPAMAFHPPSGKTVLFGGSRVCGIGERQTSDCQDFTPMADTWVWDGALWTKLAPLLSPPARHAAQLAYHLPTRKLVLFGGEGASGGLNDTWTWDGATWAQEHPRVSPPSLGKPAMAEHEASRRLVLFGGTGLRDGQWQALRDTWTWDGSTWTEETSAATSPPAAGPGEGAMADHKASGKLVFVGEGTWTWDGSSWTQMTTASTPVGGVMTYLAATREIVLAGGGVGGDETWTWDGHQWTMRRPSTPPPDYGGPMAYHGPSERVVYLRTPGRETEPTTRGGARLETWTWWGAPRASLTQRETKMTLVLEPDSIPADSQTRTMATVTITVNGVPYPNASVEMRTTGDATVEGQGSIGIGGPGGSYQQPIRAGTTVGTQSVIATARDNYGFGDPMGSASATLTQTEPASVPGEFPANCPSGIQEGATWKDLDWTFGCGGKVVSRDAGRVTDLAVHGDGLVVASAGLMRLGPNGEHDTAFNNPPVAATAIAVDRQDRIVAAVSNPNSSEYGVRRYLPNGEPDESFAGGQMATLEFASIAGKHFDPRDVGVQRDGKILLAGHVESRAALARLTERGEPDTTFGPAGDGVIVSPQTTAPFYNNKLALQADGKAVVAGRQDCFLVIGAHPKCFFGVARYNIGVPGKRDGTLDETFNPCVGDSQPACGGVALTDFGENSNATAHSIAVQPDGKIVLAGEYWKGQARIGFALARYNVGAPPRSVGGREMPTPDGTLDETFNPCLPTMPPCGGLVVTDSFPGWEYRERGQGNIGPNYAGIGQDVVIQPDGKIMVAGYGPYLSGSDWLVARYNPNGSLDTCHTAGFARTRFGHTAEALAIALHDGKIVVGGFARFEHPPTSNIFAVARYMGGSVPSDTEFSIADAGRVAEPGSGSDLAVFEVTLSAPACEALTVDYSTLAGRATPGADFEATSSSLTFRKDEQRKLIAVPVLADDEVEDDETFHVELSNPRSAGSAEPTDALLGRSPPPPAATLKRATATAIITDSGPKASIGDQTVPEPTAGAAPAAFTVTLSAAPTHPVSVGYATADGTATAGADYQAAAGRLSFAAGETSKTIAVSVLGDTLAEDSEGFSVELTDPAGLALGDTKGEGTILDAVMGASVGDVAVTEGNAGTTKASFTVVVNGPTRPVTVSYATTAGTATQGDDYLAAEGSINFGPEDPPGKAVVVEVVADTLPEPDEDFALRLIAATGTALARAQGTGRIVDDDGDLDPDPPESSPSGMVTPPGSATASHVPNVPPQVVAQPQGQSQAQQQAQQQPQMQSQMQQQLQSQTQFGVQAGLMAERQQETQVERAKIGGPEPRQLQASAYSASSRTSTALPGAFALLVGLLGFGLALGRRTPERKLSHIAIETRQRR